MTINRTIVAGYDGSAAARAAVAAAIDLTGPEGQLIIVHAYEVPPGYMGEPYYQDMLDRETSRSENVLRDLEMSIEGLAGVVHQIELIAGDPARAILNVAEVQHAHEIVLGSRGRGRVTSWLLGSVAQRVIHGAHCPVLVMPQRMFEEPATSGRTSSAVA